MSEHRHYELAAVDRGLNEVEMAALRAISTWAANLFHQLRQQLGQEKAIGAFCAWPSMAVSVRVAAGGACAGLAARSGRPERPDYT